MVGNFLLVVAVLIFCGLVFFGGVKLEQGIATAAFGLIGTVMGLAGANAAQVYGYFFGSSQGSKDKSEALNRAVAGMGSASYAVAGDSPPTLRPGSPPARGAPPPRKG